MRLLPSERLKLDEMVRKGMTQAYRIKHAHILLAVDADGLNWEDRQAAEAFGCHANTVANVRQRFVEQGIEAAIERKKQESPSRQRLLDGEKETRSPIRAAPPRPATIDYEYERNGTTTNFMFTETLAGWQKVNVRERKTKLDWAAEIKELLDVDYPDAEQIVLVCDNLNTHNLSSLYEAFEPAEARRHCERLEIHYTPKHGGWLNITECELSVFTRQCLGRRMADPETLRAEAKAWYRRRNTDQKTVDWQFTTDDARVKLLTFDWIT